MPTPVHNIFKQVITNTMENGEICKTILAVPHVASFIFGIIDTRSLILHFEQEGRNKIIVADTMRKKKRLTF